jgi:tetratricopeptide (TPR) repeat protein
VGRLHEALAVLEAGLKEHPGYLSALVAKGRCLLELGSPEPAREVLERVVRQDATQAVANKLLVRAYLDTGQAERARERLDLYSLLHDGDPEIEELRGRIRRLDASRVPAPARPEPARAAAAAPFAPAVPAADDPFFLPPPPLPKPSAPLAPVRVAVSAPLETGDVFQLDAPPAPRRAAPPVFGDVFELDDPAATSTGSATSAGAASTATLAAAPLPVQEVTEAPEALDEPEPTPEGEPFPGLVSRAVRQRYLTGLAAEGLFAYALDLTPAPPVAVAERVETAESHQVAAPVEPAPAPEPIHTPGEIFPLRSIGEAVEAELWRTPAAPEPPAPEPEPATVTLGDLYLRQGHVGEAEQIFQEVLRREPDNAAAREALAQVASSRVEPAAASASPPEEPATAPGDRRVRKIQLLNSYLQRIRRGSQPDVP